MIKEKLSQIISERTSELEKYALTPNANGWYIDKENQLLASLTDIFNELDDLLYPNIWKDVEQYWLLAQSKDQDFSGIQLDIRLKPQKILYYLNLNLYEF